MTVNVDKLATGALGVAVKLTICGLPGASSAKFTDAVRSPAAVGLKVTLIWQLALTASVLLHVSVCAKSPAFGPVIEILDRVSPAVPVLVNVRFCGAPQAVGTTMVPQKFRLDGETLATGNKPWSNTR